MPPDLSPPCPERKKIKLREISKPKTPPVEIQSKVAPTVVASASSYNDAQLKNSEESPKSKTQNKINEYEIVSIETCNEPEMPTSTKNDKKSQIYPPGKNDSQKLTRILVYKNISVSYYVFKK